MIRLLYFYFGFLTYLAGISGLNSIRYIFLIILSVWSVVKIIATKQIILNKNDIKIVRIFIALILISVISTMLFWYDTCNIDIITPYIRLILLLPIMYIVYIRKDIKLIKAIFRYSIIINFISLGLLISDISKFSQFRGMFSHGNFYSFYLVGIIVLSIYYLFKSMELWKKVAIYIYFLINILLLLACGSKTAMSSLVVIICLSFIIFYKKSIKNKSTKKYLLLGIFIFAGISIGSLLIMNKEFLLNFRSFNVNYQLSGGQMNSFQWRLYNWSKVFQEWITIKKAFIVGLGWGSETYYGIGYSMHNEYFRMLYNLGFMGLVLYIFILVNLFKIGLGISLSEYKFLLIGICLILIVGSCFENIFVAVETTNFYMLIIPSILKLKNNNKGGNKIE